MLFHSRNLFSSPPCKALRALVSLEASRNWWNSFLAKTSLIRFALRFRGLWGDCASCCIALRSLLKIKMSSATAKPSQTIPKPYRYKTSNPLCFMGTRTPCIPNLHFYLRFRSAINSYFTFVRHRHTQYMKDSTLIPAKQVFYASFVPIYTCVSRKGLKTPEFLVFRQTRAFIYNFKKLRYLFCLNFFWGTCNLKCNDEEFSMA